MRRTLTALTFLLLSASAFSQPQCPSAAFTPNVSLSLPAVGTQNWNLCLNPNFQAIDTAIGLLQAPYKGTWSSTTVYPKGAYVVYSGSTYISVINSNFNNTPSLTSSAWQFFFTAGSSLWGGIGGTITNQTDLQNALNAKAPAPINGADQTGPYTVTGTPPPPIVNMNCAVGTYPNPSGCAFTLPALITTGFSIVVRNIGTANVTINPNGNTYDGVTTLYPTKGSLAIWVAPGGTGYHSGTAFDFSPDPNSGGILASINTQINVMDPKYGAKGDGVTDDTAAFNAAQAAALAYYGGNNLPAALYLPKPTVCYLLDHWGWEGVSLEGQPSGLGPASPQTYGVTLCGKPGHDIIHIPDPALNTGTIRVYPGYSIRNIGFSVNTSAPFDTTVGYTNAHRWPGRWFDDGAMTSGSAVFSSVGGNISCGDIGQAIQVNGAGPSGANLVTTIASVYPCWLTSQTNWQVVTLAAAASTTVTNAHSYISVLGLPVTTNIGNCAIAQDMMDGNGADWTASYNVGDYGKLENVAINGNGATGNTACGIYTQGQGMLYGIDVRNLGLYSLWAGVVQNSSELNSSLQSSSGDFEKWDHVAALFGYTPWISTNGLSQQLLQWEVTSRAGFQVLTDSNSEGDYPVGWRIEHGMECPYGSACIYGDHITGSLQDMTIALTSGAATQYGYLDTSASKCLSCNVNNTFIDGYRNDVRSAGGIGSTTVNQGKGNVITGGYVASPYLGLPPSYEYSYAPYKGSNSISGRYTSDFSRAGNYQTPYNNDDLFIWPTDLDFAPSTPYGSVVQPDNTSPSGYYMILGSNQTYSAFDQVSGRSGAAAFTVGTNLPTTGATLNMMVKCPSGTTSFTPTLKTSVGGTSQTFPCSTSWNYYSLPVKWTSLNIGQSVQVGAATGSNTFYAAWFDIVPWAGNYNGYQPKMPDGSLIANYLTGWAWITGSASNDPASPYGNVESVVTGSYITSVNGVNSTGGLLIPARPSKITYWVGAPTIFSTTLNGAVTNSATSLTLTAATTSAWGSSGYLMVDQEVMQYTGVTSGLTTITVARAKFQTVAQAHSNGAPVVLVGNGQLQVVCNSTVISATDVYYAPTYTPFSSDFPAQLCSGYTMKLADAVVVSGGTGQTFNIAQVQVSPQSSDLSIPPAANYVPVSGLQSNGWNNFFAYNSDMPLVGGGTDIVTGSVGMPLTGTTTSIGGSALAAGACASGTVSITNSTTAMAVAVSPVTNPGTGFTWQGYVSAAGTVTVEVCAISAGTPTASTYNVRVIQ